MLRFAGPWPDRQWAVEGARGLGRGIAQQLASAGELVKDVPPKLAARARMLEVGHGRKTDVLDAVSVAAVAQHSTRLTVVQAEGLDTQLRLLTDYRDDLVGERTRTLNRIHVLLRDLIAGGAHRGLSTAQAATLLRTVHPVTATDRCRKDLARALIERSRFLRPVGLSAANVRPAAARLFGRRVTGLDVLVRDHPSAAGPVGSGLSAVQLKEDGESGP